MRHAVVCQGAFEHVLWADLVGDIGDLDLGRDPPYHPLHHAVIPILDTKIG